MTNPLLTKSVLDFELPDYPQLTIDHVREAAQVGMAEQLSALTRLAESTEPPTAANVLHAWEASNVTLRRAINTFSPANSADGTTEREELEREFAPMLAAHRDAIMLNHDLYERFEALAAAATAGEVELDAQDQHLLDETLREFRRSGVDLAEADQQRLRAINSELAKLSSQFAQRLVAGRAEAAVLFDTEDEVAGLSAEQLASAKRAAEARGKTGWLVELTNTSGQPAQAALTNRESRRRVYLASVGRGLSGENDTRELVVRLARLRAERAQLLGYEHHAALAADEGCARTSEAVIDLLTGLVPGVRELAEQEAADLERRLQQTVPGAKLEPWDWEFYAAQASAENAVDHDRLRDYLEYDRVLHHGVFAAATALYGLRFERREDLVGFTPASLVFEVREADGTPLGLVIFDPFTRPTKRGGAWMTTIVDQNELFGQLPVITNTCNFAPPADGEPALLTWDNVITMFHEFGHALHGLLSQVRYPSRAGTSVSRDFVEFPSQVNEIWAWEPSLLRDYARHHVTGEPIPDELIEGLLASRQAGAGYDAFEKVAAMLLDQAWHQTPLDRLPTDASQVAEFERQALASYGVDYPLIPPRYRTGYFAHIFSGGYSARYYSYVWSEVMDADAVAWFGEHGGLCREVGDAFRHRLLARGGSVDVMDTYRDFAGRDPDPQHLLRRMGLG